MKKVALKLTLAFICFNLAYYAQEYQKTILCFNIIDANNDGKDYSAHYIKKEAYVSFYENTGDSVLRMAIVFPKDSTSSYGNLYAHPMKIKNELYDGSITEKTYYQWYFRNSYDDKNGVAIVEFSIIQKGNEPYYMLKIIPIDDFEILIYKGYLNEHFTGVLMKIEE